MKTVISKNKLKKIEALLYGGLGAIIIVSLMEGKMSDRILKMKDKITEDILKLLKN